MPYQTIGRRHSHVPLNSLNVDRLAWVGTRRIAIPQQILDVIPGGLAWTSLVIAVVGAWRAPLVLVWAAALLACYSAARFALAGAANLWGLYLVRRWRTQDWHQEYARRVTATSLPLTAVHHVVIIPNYHEDPETLHHTLGCLAQQQEAAEAMTVVLAMEMDEPGAVEKGARLQAEFGTRFKNFLVAIHPKGIAGEIQCKSANQGWAARWARRVLVDELGYDLDHLVVTTMDADTVWSSHFFESLGVLFATHPRRYQVYWQAPIRYHGNVWATNPLMRILHAYSAAWELAYLAAPWWQALPMSSYSMSMRLLDGVGYWDPDVIADEWHMFIKSFFQRGSQVDLQPIFLPFWANATAGSGLGRAIKERYLQTLRHAWGAKEIGYTIAQMAHHPHTPFRKGAQLLFRVAHDNLLAGAGWIIMMLGSQLPWLFHSALLRANMTFLPFILLQISVALITILTVLFWLEDLRIRPPRSTPWTQRERLYELASLPLLAVITFVCVALPVLHAQTRLMLGLPLHFRVAPKR